MVDDIDLLEKRLAPAGRLSEFDRQAVETVSMLIRRRRAASQIVREEGITTKNDRGVLIEHPAVKVERMASAEIRGWVKDRPDLFGEDKSEQEVQGNRLSKFRVVE